VLRKPGVSAPIVGATKIEQLDEAAAAVSLQLSDEDVAELEAHYLPHAVAGFR
jgi:aryl-alcohol dehydrogenase-like predicted oxidoreductase